MWLVQPPGEAAGLVSWSTLPPTVPRKGDECYIATDACTSLPAVGAKLFLKKPGIDRYLLSFSFGFRVPTNMTGWQPCEVEAFGLAKAIDKYDHYIKVTQNTAVALIDSKPTLEAQKRLERGQFSASRKLQDLLANLTSKRIVLQLISAKLPSPILHMVDFASRHPVRCDVSLCNICKEMAAYETTICGRVTPQLSLLSTSSWLDIQHSCPELRKVFAYISSGKEPSKKERLLLHPHVKKYLQRCTINKDNLLVVKSQLFLQATPIDLIVIPQSYALTFSKALHVQLDHPLHAQMVQQFDRRYFMLNKLQILMLRCLITVNTPVKLHGFSLQRWTPTLQIQNQTKLELIIMLM